MGLCVTISVPKFIVFSGVWGSFLETTRQKYNGLQRIVVRPAIIISLKADASEALVYMLC